MSIDWDTRQSWLEYAHKLWDARPMLSTREIAEQCSKAWGEPVTKNVIISRAHAFNWEPRPSPIKRNKTLPAPESPAVADCLPPGGNPRHRTLPAMKSVTMVEEIEPLIFDTCSFAVIEAPPPAPPAPPVVRLPPRDPGYRRDGTGCLNVSQVPNERGRLVYKTCDRPLYSVTKPYCTECASSLYIKKRKDESHDEAR